MLCTYTNPPPYCSTMCDAECMLVALPVAVVVLLLLLSPDWSEKKRTVLCNRDAYNEPYNCVHMIFELQLLDGYVTCV